MQGKGFESLALVPHRGILPKVIKIRLFFLQIINHVNNYHAPVWMGTRIYK